MPEFGLESRIVRVSRRRRQVQYSKEYNHWMNWHAVAAVRVSVTTLLLLIVLPVLLVAVVYLVLS